MIEEEKEKRLKVWKKVISERYNHNGELIDKQEEKIMKLYDYFRFEAQEQKNKIIDGRLK